jgi:hypothetical protein
MILATYISLSLSMGARARARTHTHTHRAWLYYSVVRDRDVFYRSLPVVIAWKAHCMIPADWPDGFVYGVSGFVRVVYLRVYLSHFTNA